MYRNQGQDYKEFTKNNYIRSELPFGEFVDNTPFNFLNNLEFELKKIDNRVTIPSWNYTKYVEADCKSNTAAFSANRFGSSLTIKGCLNDGKFIPPDEHNRGCLKRRSLSRGFRSSQLLTEDQLLSKTLSKFWKGLMQNNDVLINHLWTLRGDKIHDPLYFSIMAYHFKLAGEWGMKNQHTIDIDFDGKPIGDESVYTVNMEEYYN